MRIISIPQLIKKANEHRFTLYDITVKTGGSYLAQALSCIDLLTAIFYRYLRFKPDDPEWDKRDRFLLSPGHYALSLYVILADLKYFPKKMLYDFKKNGSNVTLITHRKSLPGIEVSGGSLGQVLSIGVGMAISAKLRKKKHRIFVFMGDGEQSSGQVWEAAMSASHYNLNNLIAIIDANKFQVDGKTKDVMNSEPLGKKYESFNWNVFETDGNNMEEIVKSFDKVFSIINKTNKPSVVIGHTIRGKGIKFMEGNPNYHYTRFDNKTSKEALRELKNYIM
jgi:transketolase